MWNSRSLSFPFPPLIFRIHPPYFYWKSLLLPNLEPHLPSSLSSPPLPENWNDLFISWKQRYDGNFKNKKQFTLLWRKIPKFVCWELWLARNQSIFREKLPPMHSIFAKICGLVAEVFKFKVIGYDLAGTLEQSEEDWIKHILRPSSTPITFPPHQ